MVQAEALEHKSPNDPKVYRVVKLDNGLQALLIHDPEIVKQKDEGVDGGGAAAAAAGERPPGAASPSDEDVDSLLSGDEEGSEMVRVGAGGAGRVHGSTPSSPNWDAPALRWESPPPASSHRALPTVSPRSPTTRQDDEEGSSEDGSGSDGEGSEHEHVHRHHAHHGHPAGGKGGSKSLVSGRKGVPPVWPHQAAAGAYCQRYRGGLRWTMPRRSLTHPPAPGPAHHCRRRQEGSGSAVGGRGPLHRPLEPAGKYRGVGSGWVGGSW